MESLLAEVGDLAFFRSVVGTWEQTLYALKHMCRAAFALKMQELLCARSPGGGGKDTLCNRMHCLLGRYAANLPFEALSAARDMDSPSQTILALRGKRFVCVREVGASAKLRGHVVKTLADAIGGWIKARGLWGKDVSFLPHFLLFIATNVIVAFDEVSGPGLQRRHRMLTFPYMFVDEPRRANERKKDPTVEDRFAERNPAFFHLLLMVYTIFLRDGRPNSVTPVPADVDEATKAELREPWMDALDRFVANRLCPAKTASQATSAAQVREALESIGILAKEAGLRLAAYGFAEGVSHYKVGSHRSTKRTYTFAFHEGAEPSLVKLLPKPSSAGASSCFRV